MTLFVNSEEGINKERENSNLIVLKNKFIGDDTEIFLTKNKKNYSVSMCIINLQKEYSNQFYCDFNEEKDARVYYEAISCLSEQKE